MSNDDRKVVESILRMFFIWVFIHLVYPKNEKLPFKWKKNCDIKKHSYSYSKMYAKRNYYNYISLRYIKILNKEKSENSPSIDQNNYWATII